MQVAQALGEMAMLLDNIELRGLRPPTRVAGPARAGSVGAVATAIGVPTAVAVDG